METMDNEILQVLSARKSVRVYTDEPVTEAERNAILQAAFQAPTAGNQQLYTILNITDPALKARLADLCIVTEDNSRGEPLEAIFADIRAGMDRVQNGAACVEISNRRDALLYALGLGREGDILAVLGKGHETTIDRDGRKVPFEDAAVVREYMERVK